MLYCTLLNVFIVVHIKNGSYSHHYICQQYWSSGTPCSPAIPDKCLHCTECVFRPGHIIVYEEWSELWEKEMVVEVGVSHTAGGRHTLTVVIQHWLTFNLTLFFPAVTHIWQPNTATNINKFLDPQSVRTQIHTQHHKVFLNAHIDTSALCQILPLNRKEFFY
jgi:hypothetical protein